MSLSKELTAVLNANSAENGSNTPDYVLGAFLIGCLQAFDRAVKARELWHGKEGGPPQDTPNVEAPKEPPSARAVAAGGLVCGRPFSDGSRCNRPKDVSHGHLDRPEDPLVWRMAAYLEEAYVALKRGYGLTSGHRTRLEMLIAEAFHELAQGHLGDLREGGQVGKNGLLPCPFCGSDTAPGLVHDQHDTSVACYGIKGGCGAFSGGIANDEPTCEQEAIAAWNRRAPGPPQAR